MDQVSHPEVPLDLLKGLGLDDLPSREEIHREIKDRLLSQPEKLPENWLPTYQIHWQHAISVPSLLPIHPAKPPTSLTFVRAGLEGRVTGYKEFPNVRTSAGQASTSMDRAPAPINNFVRGKSGHLPFWPGGLDGPAENAEEESGIPSRRRGLRTVPPGFSRGLQLPEDKTADDAVLDLENYPEGSAPLQDEPTSHDLAEPSLAPGLSDGGASEIDSLLPTSRSHIKAISSSRKTARRVAVQKRDWAHVVDVNKPMNNFKELVPVMAHTYPFELDTFQKEAVYHLEMGDSVFVAAHTSAGKTVVAEYAIALAQKHMTRTIYTSPIKALSNQKFRDFKQTFSSSSVGILTGDVQINPEGSCLVMTTEILRSMLYKGADLIRDVEFVIFDEVHYVNDAERGVVWEEVIIMLPDHVNIILLSATVPNTKEFADWIGRTKKKDIYVISTLKRPVPLEHWLYAGRDLCKIVDAQRSFLGQGYKDAGEALRRKQDKEREAAGLPPVQRVGARGNQRGGPAGRGGPNARGGPNTRGGQGPQRGSAPTRGGGPPRTMHMASDKNLYVHLVGILRKKDLLPVVVFTFSKKRCEEYAATLRNSDLCTSVAKSEVHVTIEKALARLNGSDRRLPQIGRMRDLLSRGIGVHHGGLLPIVKEVVEILFSRGLVKVLFATETFAMGVNMPTKCVVFSDIRKHDGRAFRHLLPGEYTQMAGRAGRRGLDTTGTVIIIAHDSLPELQTLQQMILGTPTKLSSQFRLTYNMILNLLRVEALRVEEMIKRSFSENASQRLLPVQQKKVLESEHSLSNLKKLSCHVCSPDIYTLYDNTYQIATLNEQLLELASNHQLGAKLLAPGRVIILRDGHFRSSNVAVLLKQAPTMHLASNLGKKVKMYFILALVNSEIKSGTNDTEAEAVPPVWPPSPESLLVDSILYEVRPVPLTSIIYVTQNTVKVDVNAILDRRSISKMTNGVRKLETLVNEWMLTSSIPEVEWSRIRALSFQEVYRSRNALLEKQTSKECLSCDSFEQHYAMVHEEKLLLSKIANLKLAMSEQNLELIPDYEQRIEVLKELKFIDENSTVLLKGRVACEINSANELVLTELILENALAKYEPEEVVALLSCFVFQEKTDVEPEMSPRLEEGRDAIIAISDRIERVQDFHEVAAVELKSTLRFGLVEVVYEWANGMPFEQITSLTDIPEGTIVRVITRLDETCREVRDAARVIGDAELFRKMEEAQTKIKRDIVFAASLYF